MSRRTNAAPSPERVIFEQEEIQRVVSTMDLFYTRGLVH